MHYVYMKAWLRRKKLALVDSVNPEWHDMGERWYSMERDPSLRAG